MSLVAWLSSLTWRRPGEQQNLAGSSYQGLVARSGRAARFMVGAETRNPSPPAA